MKDQIESLNTSAFPESTIPKLRVESLIAWQDEFFKTLDIVKNSSFQIMQQVSSQIQQWPKDGVPEKLIWRYMNAKMMYMNYNDMCEYYKDFKSQNGEFKARLPDTFVGSL